MPTRPEPRSKAVGGMGTGAAPSKTSLAHFIFQCKPMFCDPPRTLNGKINDFYKGFIYLFRTSDIGILPVTLNGFYKLKPKNRFYINFNTKLEVVIHKPIRRDELVEKSDTEIIETIKSVIESAYLKNHYDGSEE